jgi:hypothetical protein
MADLPFSTSQKDQLVKLRIGEGPAAAEPKTIMQCFDKTVAAYKDKPAIHAKLLGEVSACVEAALGRRPLTGSIPSAQCPVSCIRRITMASNDIQFHNPRLIDCFVMVYDVRGRPMKTLRTTFITPGDNTETTLKNLPSPLYPSDSLRETPSISSGSTLPNGFSVITVPSLQEVSPLESTPPMSRKRASTSRSILRRKLWLWKVSSSSRSITPLPRICQT